MPSQGARRTWCYALLLAVTACARGPGAGAVATDPPQGKRPGSTDACELYRATSYRELYGAKDFSSESAVYEEVTPAAVSALRCMTQEADAIPRLKDLATRGWLAGQLYALVGLRALDKQEFDRRIKPFLSNRTKLVILGGDVFVEHRVEEIAAGIASGAYVAHFIPEFKHLVPEAATPTIWLEVPDQ